MNNVIPISDLISYNQILSKVQEGNGQVQNLV